MWATKTLDLAEMEIKVSNFVNNTQFPHINGPISSQSKEGLCVKRN